MTSRDFAYWLQGFFEISEDTPVLSPRQVEIIKNHLNLVFYHEIDAQYDNTEESQAVHDGDAEKDRRFISVIQELNVQEQEKPREEFFNENPHLDPRNRNDGEVMIKC